MKDFGTALKRALDANGRLPSELAKAAGVTGTAVATNAEQMATKKANTEVPACLHG